MTMMKSALSLIPLPASSSIIPSGASQYIRFFSVATEIPSGTAAADKSERFTGWTVSAFPG
jgi:hypothetical protein